MATEDQFRWLFEHQQKLAQQQIGTSTGFWSNLNTITPRDRFTTAIIKGRKLVDDGYGSPSSVVTKHEIRDYKTEMFIGDDGEIIDKSEIAATR